MSGDGTRRSVSLEEYEALEARVEELEEKFRIVIGKFQLVEDFVVQRKEALAEQKKSLAEEKAMFAKIVADMTDGQYELPPLEEADSDKDKQKAVLTADQDVQTEDPGPATNIAVAGKISSGGSGMEVGEGTNDKEPMGQDTNA